MTPNESPCPQDLVVIILQAIHFLIHVANVYFLRIILGLGQLWDLGMLSLQETLPSQSLYF